MKRLALFLLASAACTNEASFEEPIARTSEAIIDGTPSTSAQDAVIALGWVPNGKAEALCSGTLVAPNLVLTARHCVSETDEQVLCSGATATFGGRVFGYHDAHDMVVAIGTSPKAVARGTKIIADDDAKVLCERDIAFVVLDRNVNAPIAPLRILGGAKIGETVTAVGWGYTEDGVIPKVRMTRSGIDVLAADKKEFVVGEAICQGDSGGPALDAKTGAVVGVVSRGNNPKPAGTGPQAACMGTAMRNIYTNLAGFPDIVDRAFDAAHATPWEEGKAKPLPPEPEEEDPVSADPSASTTTTTSSSSCSATEGPASSSGALIVLAALFVSLRRRGSRPA